METNFVQYIGKTPTLVRKIEGGGKDIVKPLQVFEASSTIKVDLLRCYPELFILAEEKIANPRKKSAASFRKPKVKTKRELKKKGKGKAAVKLEKTFKKVSDKFIAEEKAKAEKKESKRE